MNRLLVIYLLLLLSALSALSGCISTPQLPSVAADVEIVAEQSVTEIPLVGPVSEANAEISGLTWYKDWLILLPQYPSVVDNSLYALAKADIIAFLDGKIEGPLTPQPIALEAPALENLPNFEGVEAITFNGDDVYVTVETNQGAEMLGYMKPGWSI